MIPSEYCYLNSDSNQPSAQETCTASASSSGLSITSHNVWSPSLPCWKSLFSYKKTNRKKHVLGMFSTSPGTNLHTVFQHWHVAKKFAQWAAVIAMLLSTQHSCFSKQYTHIVLQHVRLLTFMVCHLSIESCCASVPKMLINNCFSKILQNLLTVWFLHELFVKAVKNSLSFTV